MTYASKYYDPVKAHEYYMAHRQLKGDKTKTPEEQALAKRRSTASLNDYGKSVAKQVREQISEERKAAYKLITQQVSVNIKALRKQWKEMGISKEEIKRRVQEIRDQAKAYKKQVKALYQEKYLKELDQIKQDPSMLKEKKSKGRKKKKK